MAVERTLSIIKPDAVAKNVIGEIYSRFERAGLKIVAAKMTWLARSPMPKVSTRCTGDGRFSRTWSSFMTSGPVMIQVLEGENAIAKNRDLMGATDPKKAAPGTIRADFAESIDANAAHGSRRGPRKPRSDRDRVFLSDAWKIHSRARRPSTDRSIVATMINLLDFDQTGLAALFAGRGEKPFRAKQTLRWIHRGLADRVDAMSDLAKATRECSGRRRGDPRAGGGAGHDGQRRHAQVAARCRWRQRHRGGLHSRGRSRYAVHFLAGRLRARLRVLLDRQAGLQPQSRRRRDRRPAVARQPRAACRWRRNAMGRTGSASDHQCRDDGHGRAAGQLRQCRRRDEHHARRQRLWAVAPPRDAVDVRASCRPSTGSAMRAPWRWP